MSLLSLGIANPDFIKDMVKADVQELPAIRADYESNAPTGTLPPMSDVESWEQLLIGMRTATGQLVTPERAKRCAAVLAIMRGLSEDISALPLELFKRNVNGDVLAPDHNVHTMLNLTPNDIMTPLEVREHMMLDLMTWGGFFNLKQDDPDSPGDLLTVWPLQAAYVTRRWREPVWTFTDPLTGMAGTFTNTDVWRGTIMSSNGIDGTAITLLCREAIGLLLAAEEQGARLFAQGVQSDLVLENSGEAMDDDSKKALRQAFMAKHSGSWNSWIPVLLEGGITAKRVGLTAQESQYIEARNFQIGDIARAFRYPDVLLGGTTSGKSATYASASQFFESYTKHTLLPWGIRIEQTGNRDLLTPKERMRLYLKHDFDQLLRPDQSARYDNYNKAINGGWMMLSEPRKKERLPFIEGLDKTLQPLNMSSGGQDSGSPEPAPTDQSGLNITNRRFADTGSLPRSVAEFIVKREEKALIGKKEDVDIFYSNFGALIEDITGADYVTVRAYLEMRRGTVDRFTPEAIEAAITAILNMRG